MSHACWAVCKQWVTDLILHIKVSLEVNDPFFNRFCGPFSVITVLCNKSPPLQLHLGAFWPHALDHTLAEVFSPQDLQHAPTVRHSMSRRERKP